MSSPVAEPPPPRAPVKQSPSRARKPAVLASAAVAAGALLSCTAVKVRPTPEDELAWLASCPAEKREVVHTLGIYPGAPNEEGPAIGILFKEENVIPHRIGCEVREGPISVSTSMSPTTASGTLYGEVREGTDNRVFFRFHELRMADGRKFPICAIAAQSFAWGPGVYTVADNAKSRVPKSELNPEFLYITTGRLRIRVAPYLPNRGGGQ